MIARVHINPSEWPHSEGVLVDRYRAGTWRHVGLYALRERDIDVDVEPGDRLRLAGFRQGDVPYGSPAGVVALLLSDYVEVTV